MEVACTCGWTDMRSYLGVQVIELPIKHPELFESLGVAQPKVNPNPRHSIVVCIARLKVTQQSPL